MSHRILKSILYVLVVQFIAFSAYAEDVALHDGETYLGCKNIGNTNIFLNDPNDYESIKAGFIYLPNGCSSLPQVAPKYLKVISGEVVEMNTVEKAAIDILEAQAEQTAKDARDARLEVTQGEALTALIQVVNVRLPAGQKITKQELIDKIKANR